MKPYLSLLLSLLIVIIYIPNTFSAKLNLESFSKLVEENHDTEVDVKAEKDRAIKDQFSNNKNYFNVLLDEVGLFLAFMVADEVKLTLYLERMPSSQLNRMLSERQEKTNKTPLDYAVSNDQLITSLYLFGLGYRHTNNKKLANVNQYDKKYELVTDIVENIRKNPKKIGSILDSYAPQIEKEIIQPITQAQKELLIEFRYGKNKNSLLHLMAEANSSKVLELVVKLTDQKDYINLKNKSLATALHFAALNGNLKTANLLIKNGADINVKNIQKFTPLHIAVRNNHTEIISALLVAGASPIELGPGDNTPIHIAVEQNNQESLKLLLKKATEKKLDLNTYNDSGYTALQAATSRGNSALAKLLENAGAEQALLTKGRYPERTLADLKERAFEKTMARLAESLKTLNEKLKALRTALNLLIP